MFRGVFIRTKLTFQSLFKLVIPMQCPIYLSKYSSQVENLTDLDSFSTEEKVSDSSNLFFQHMANTKHCEEECVYFGI